jgi:hypothetical protein
LHTALVIFGGLLLLAVFAIFGWLRGGVSGVPVAARWFLPAWLAVALANLRVGVTRAGYTLAEELPVLALNLAPPVLAALAVAWRIGRA